MYYRPGNIIKKLFPSLVWNITCSDAIYLTFDDGPIEHITPWVLDTLRKYNAKATFFCTGKNAEQNPHIVERIKAEGHAIGNHTYSHTKVLLDSCEEYVEDVELANSFLNTNLFRPPYGRISPAKIRRLNQRYKIIMWDNLSFDYSRYTTGRKCARKVIEHLKPGSIIVFHDSLKAARNMRYALPRVLEAAQMMNLKCKAIEIP